jgi:HK97 family phage portal protein
LKLAIAYYLLSGETFWYLERKDDKAMPTAMVNMRPDYVEILLNQKGNEIVAYRFYQNNGQMVDLQPFQVLHIKNIDPINPTRGVGVIRPASQRIITEREASRYQALTFKTGGRPDIAVFLDQDLKEEDAADARERWNKIYGGEDGAKAGFFGNQVKDLKLLNVSPKEMDGIASMNFLRDDILAALRIPKAMITSDDVNLANSKTARNNYKSEACEPVLDTFIDVINNKLINADEDKFVTFESEVNEDRELLLKEATELKKGGIITANEARALMNYPDAEDEGADQLSEFAGSTFQLSMKKRRLAKLAKQHLKKRPNVYRKFVAIEATARLIMAERAVKRERNPVFHTTEQKEKYIKAFNKNIDAKAGIFRDTVEYYNRGLLARILERLEKFGLTVDNFMDPGFEMREARDIFLPLMTNLYQKTGQETLDSVANGFASKVAEQFYTAEEMLKALEFRAEFFTSSMLNTDFDELREILVEGMDKGQGVAEIGRNLRGYFEDMSVSRARTIARTETGRLVSEATNEAYKQSAVVTGKIWLSAGDNNVRPEHQDNEAQGAIANDAAFQNGEMYPGQLTINCRCALAPAV